MKNIIKISFAFILFFMFFINASAYTIIGRAINNGTNIRTGASTSFSIIGKSEYNVEFEVLEILPTENVSVCSNYWYKFNYNGNDGYMCGDYVTIYVKMDSSDEIEIPTSTEGLDEETIKKIERKKYEIELKKSFPESYIPYLVLLHEKHPNWQFEALNTGIKFAEAVKAESALGVSLIQDGYADDGWKTTVSPGYDYGTDKWKSYDSGSWVAVNSETVAYFMDPRNFLNETRIFQFEKLNYDETYQTIEAVQSVFGSGSIFYPVASSFIEAGKAYDVNAVYLAAKVRGEVGVNGSGSTSGRAFTYNNVTYKGGIYNVYNIGAYKTSSASAIDRGLYWAMGGFGISNPDKYLRPWTSLDLSIRGGAYYIANGYINVGQYTTYLQRFNVAKGYMGTSHQYQTDIKSPYNASSSSYSSYYKNNLIDNAFKFTIPIYDEMPEATYLPKSGNPNNHLKELKVNNTLLNSFEHDKNEYTFYVRSGATSVTIEGTPINSNATLTGVGDIMLTGDSTEAVVEVTAENGDKNIYKINIIKSGSIQMTPDDIIDASSIKKNNNYISGLKLGSTVENLNTILNETCPGIIISVKASNGNIKTTGALATGDTISITNGSDTKDYILVIYGDASGDGIINIIDLIRVQKNILGFETLNGAFKLSADANQDGDISIIDLIKIQKYILGYGELA